MVVDKKKIQLFDIMNYIFIALVSFSMLYPFWHCLVGSLVDYSEYVSKTFIFFPKNPTLEVYRTIIEEGRIFRPFINTAVITVVETVVVLFTCSYTAYGLSKRFYGRKAFMIIILISMFVRTGLIPVYILFRQLGLLNNYAVYIVPNLIVPYYLILMRTSFKSIGDEIFESAKMDGCTEFGMFFRFALPLSKAMLAAIGLFIAVGSWNSLFPSLFFITDPKKKVLQEYLYRMLQNIEIDAPGLNIESPLETVKLGNIIITIIPIIMVYPFLQKHFVKGVMLGSLKE
jgi:putative aldouronate transport system permease protein